VTLGSEPAVAFELDGVEHRLSCRLIVGADGRSSTVRAQAEIRLLRDEPTHLISGMLVGHVPEWPQEDIAIGTEGDVHFFVFPTGWTEAPPLRMHGSRSAQPVPRPGWSPAVPG